MPLDLSLVLALVALVIGAVPAAMAWKARGSSARVGHMPLVAAALGAAYLVPVASALIVQSAFPDLGNLLDITLFSIGFVGAAVIALLFNWLDEDSGLDGGLGALGAFGVILVKGQAGPLAAQNILSVTLGLCAACLAWAALGYRQGAMRLALPAGSLLVAAGLLAFREGDVPTLAPGILAVSAAIGSLVAWGLSSSSEQLKANKGRIGLVLLLVIGLVLGFANLPIGSHSKVGVILAIASVITLVLDLSLAKGLNLSGIGAILYLSAASWSFSQLQGSGLALFAAAGALASLVAGRSDFLPFVAPLLGFSVYRLVLESSEGATKAFDIGQHYGMIGLLAGAFLVLAVVQLLEGMVVDCKIPLTRSILTALAVGAAFLGGALLLGDKGVAGLIIGASLPAVLLAGRKQGQALAASLVGLGTGSLLALSWKGLSPYVDLTRDAKQTALIVFGLAAVIFGAAAVTLARSKQEVRNG